MSIEDLQKTDHENDHLQRETEAAAGFNSTADAAFENSTAKIVPEANDDAFALSVDPNGSATQDGDRGTDTTVDG